MKRKILIMVIIHLLVACKAVNNKNINQKSATNSSPQNSNNQSFQNIKFNNSDVREFTRDFYDEANKRGIVLHHTKEILIVEKSASV